MFRPKDHEDHQATGSAYMKWQEGDNKFRVLSEPIVGWIYFTNENKPKRSEYYPENFHDSKRNPDGSPSFPKEFCTFIVWNYGTKQVEILEITQKTIRKQLEKIAQDEDYGDIKGYDVTVNREGEGLETSYQVTPKPPKQADEAILEAYSKSNINLKALYDAEDPFTAPNAVKGVTKENGMVSADIDEDVGF